MYLCFSSGICVTLVKITAKLLLVYIDRQDPTWLFYERVPENLDEAHKEVRIALFGPGSNNLKYETDDIRTAQQEAEYHHQVTHHQLVAQKELLSLVAQDELVVKYYPNEQEQMDEKSVQEKQKMRL